jgi:Family of unknown function (DUF6159)
MSGGRIQRGWALAKQSFRVLRADRSLLLFPVISVPAALAAAAIVMGPGVALYAADHQEAILIAFGVVTFYALTFIALFFNTALAAAASQSLAGRDTSVGDGLSVARQRLGVIAAWALVQTVVGVIVNALESVARDNIVGRILVGLLNFAWSAATFFVIPVIALEGAGPRDAFKRSVELLRERWGEGAVGTVSVGGVVFLIALLPIAALAGGGFALLGSAQAVGIALLVAAAAVAVAAMLVSGTVGAIFRVALYEYASENRTVGGFDPTALQSAFGPRRGR